MKTPAFRKRKQNKFAIITISIAVAMLLIVVTIDGMRLSKKYQKNLDELAELRESISAEEIRTKELVEFEKYTKTKKYAEEVAEDKLGLVHDDEIIFKPDETD